MKQFLSFILLLLFVTGYSVSQDKIGGNEPTPFFYSTGNGNTGNPMLSTTQPEPQQFSIEKQSLLNQLKEARLSNNLNLVQQIQKALNQMEGSVTSETLPRVRNEDVGIISGNQQDMNQHQPPFANDPDYNVSTLNSAGNWAVATATSNYSTAIFAATTEYFNGAGDQMKVYVSYNGGASWVLKYTFNSFAATVDCRPGELDIEPVINGADTILFVTFGYNYTGHAFVLINRVNIGTGAGTFDNFGFGGWLGSTFQTYNPKITSDSPNWGSGTFVYVTVSVDSATTGGNSKITQRYAYISAPFTNITLTYRIANTGGGGFWWFSTATTGTYLYQDVCYYSGPGDRVYTVFNHLPLQTLYLAWSNDYGATNAGNAQILENSEISRAVIAANGGTTQNLCIGYRKFFGVNDYDFRGQFSSTGGLTAGSYTSYYPEFTSNNSRLIDIQAIDLANGRYVFAYATENNGNHYYVRTNNAGLTFATTYQTNSAPGDTVFGGVRAGYRAGGSVDSGLVVWQQVNGSGAYCSYNIASTVGVQGNSNEVPNVYSLNQNYPNPFNPTTNIKFTIPNAGLVSLVVYDITGSVVATIINQNMNAGVFTADFDASSLSSGVYFYKLTSGSFAETKKMILIK